MFQQLSDLFMGTLQSVGGSVVLVLPQIILAVVLVIVGAIIGAGIARLIMRGMETLKIDAVLTSAGVSALVARSGYTLRSGVIVGKLVQWFITLVFVVMAFDVLGLTEVTTFLREVVLSYLPHVVAAVLILLSAAVVAEFVHNIVVGASRAADVRTHYILGTSARFAIWAFAVLAALDQLQVATAFVQTLFTGVVVAISLALGLSFGLGGRDAAARYIEHVSRELHRKDGQE